MNITSNLWQFGGLKPEEQIESFDGKNFVLSQLLGKQFNNHNKSFFIRAIDFDIKVKKIVQQLQEHRHIKENKKVNWFAVKLFSF